MATVTVSDSGGTILVDDTNSQWYIKKQKVTVSTDSAGNVIIRADEVHYAQYPAASFISPSGTASQIAAAIEVFLDA